MLTQTLHLRSLLETAVAQSIRSVPLDEERRGEAWQALLQHDSPECRLLRLATRSVGVQRGTARELQGMAVEHAERAREESVV